MLRTHYSKQFSLAKLKFFGQVKVSAEESIISPYLKEIKQFYSF